MGARAGVLDEVAAERRRQDQLWGGEAHDDRHTPYDWFTYLQKQLNRFRVHKNWSDKRERLIKIAALAVAAIESGDRKNASKAVN